VSVPAPVGPGSRLSRRGALLVLGALTAAAGCTADAPPQGDRRDRTEGTTEPTPQDPDVTVATEALTAQREMHALVAAVVARHPGLGERLSALAAAHAAHVAMLDGAVPSSSPGPSPSASPQTRSGGSPSGSPAPSQARVPRDPERALVTLATAERGLATTTKRLAFRAQSGAFARLLGSMAASVAQHTHDLGTSAGRAGRR